MPNETPDTPTPWITEAINALLENEPTPPSPPLVSLTYRSGLPDRLTEIGTTIEEITADLGQGFTSQRRSGTNGEYFILGSARFEVFVHTEPEKDAYQQGIEVPLAVVSKVRRRRMPYHGLLATGTVTLDPPYAQAECDIAVVHGRAQALIRYQQAVAKARQRSVRLLNQEGRTNTAHGDLHAQVRRHFSALEQMIGLLQQRSETAGARRARGVIVSPPDALPDTFCVRVNRQDHGFTSELTVQVTVLSQRKPWNLELVNVDDDLFYLTLPRDPGRPGALAPGTLAELNYKPRFGLGRHSYALGRLLREEVEGDWEALTRLVSDPSSLSVPDEIAAPRRFFDDQLNHEQRAAVAGAVSTPHAFFIQGPPGTGKTTVISEIVRQLTARGERVLLLAPMHVAVDEVLQRVGDADGVLALRASWDDSKVREDLRRFTKDRLTAEFVHKARRRESSKASQWRAEADRVRAEREIIEANAAARQARDNAWAALNWANSQRETWRAVHHAALRRASEQRRTAQQAELAMQRQLDEAGRTAVALTRDLAEAESGGASFLQRVRAAFGAGELAQLRRMAREAGQSELLARAEHDKAAAWSVSQDSAFQQLINQGRAQDKEYGVQSGRAAETYEAATGGLASVQAQLGSAGLGHLSEADLAARGRHNEEREDRLTNLAYLEQRWFELSGQLTAEAAAGDRPALSSLGDQLIAAANLVCCTTTGIGGDDDLRDADYDTLIVDEASRVIDSEFLIGAKQARRWILVGDEHQLPPYVDLVDEHHLHALAALYMAERGAADTVSAAVEYLSRLWAEDEEEHQFRRTAVEETAEHLRESGQWSTIYRPAYKKAYERLHHDNQDAERELLSKMRHHLVESVFERCVSSGPRGLSCSLIEQHRMIDPIAALVRDPVYAGKYLSPPPERQTVTPLVTLRTFPQPVAFLDTSDHPRAGETPIYPGFFNALEAEWVETACRAWDRELSARGEDDVTVSVLTFYKAQARLIRERLGAPKYQGFRVLRFKNIDTIDRLQGQESDLILISFCRTRRGKERERHRFGMWLQDIRRLNVACTRAKRALVLVGHKNTLSGMRGLPAAENFYAHLFELLSPPSAPGMVLLKQLDRPDR